MAAHNHACAASSESNGVVHEWTTHSSLDPDNPLISDNIGTIELVPLPGFEPGFPP
jgi:hypothetical protein